MLLEQPFVCKYISKCAYVFLVNIKFVEKTGGVATFLSSDLSQIEPLKWPCTTKLCIIALKVRNLSGDRGTDTSRRGRGMHICSSVAVVAPQVNKAVNIHRVTSSTLSRRCLSARASISPAFTLVARDKSARGRRFLLH